MVHVQVRAKARRTRQGTSLACKGGSGITAAAPSDMSCKVSHAGECRMYFIQ